ncbi:DUF3817 domain-containing protein [Phreatobacter stygius]|uniref:DUF3817 domain-containing protein n=2 Tax=Phreatobacter stygius TaxID=1940610 RepID=A0A4D7BND2_9HYPH|nr:DUF3817 domain-containing protein [Phreatobacter stygius]
MRLVSLIEGTTLVALVFVAVPLKRLAGYPLATTIMGPVYGLAFVLYVWMLIQTVTSGHWPRRDVIRLLVVAFIPFGAFWNERDLRRRQAALASPA